jgi:multidrug efflux pump subunit AcrA (membrane-fusion protein)
MRLGAVRRRWWAVIALVVVAAGSGAWFMLASGNSADGSTQRITATISRGTYKDTVAATGKISPKRDEDLSFTSSGVVSAVEVKVGDRVQKGDVLARIDDTALIAQRDAAQAQVTAAKAQLSEDSGGTSTQIAADEASVASAESQLDEAKDAVENATLRAPFAGMVSAVGYSVGDQAGGSAQGSGGSDQGSTSAITVISPRTLLVEAEVSASDVSRLKKGMQAEVTPTGGGDVVYGTVSEIGVIASASDSGAAQFPVTIAVTGTPSGLFPGSSASVSIIVSQANNVLTVPTQALHSSGNTTYVYVISGGKRIKRTVTLGKSYGMQTEVTSGLKVGEVVEVISFTRRSGSGTNNNGGNGTFQLPSGTQKGAFPGGGQAPGGLVIQGGGPQ